MRALSGLLLLASACAASAQVPEVAWVHDPARAVYGHAVLGDTPEWHGLSVTTAGGVKTLWLPEDHVFEDLAPRVVQIDDDPAWEVVVVESRFDAGAALAVYEIAQDGPRLEARTPWIGRRVRWLAPAGIADLDGDGRVEIAYVETPHIGGTLRVWRLEDGALRQIASTWGYSNHRIGQAFIPGGLADCPEGPAIVTADSSWRVARVTVLTEDGALDSRDAPLEALDRLPACP